MCMMTRLTFLAVFTALIFCGCNNKGNMNSNARQSDPTKKVTEKAPARLQAQGREEVTFFPTYGRMEGDDWVINLRGWVHENAGPMNKFVTQLAGIKNLCQTHGMELFSSRSDDFVDEDKFKERVIIAFDSDPENRQYTFDKRSNLNGIVELRLSTGPQKRGTEF